MRAHAAIGGGLTGGTARNRPPPAPASGPVGPAAAAAPAPNRRLKYRALATRCVGCGGAEAGRLGRGAVSGEPDAIQLGARLGRLDFERLLASGKRQSGLGVSPAPGRGRE